MEIRENTCFAQPLSQHLTAPLCPCCSISGTLSSNISQLEGLTNVYLESNKLTGTVPREVFQLKRLSFLYLDFNQMSGTVPDNIG